MVVSDASAVSVRDMVEIALDKNDLLPLVGRAGPGRVFLTVS